ncbi:MAG: PAS domain S-box protein [Ectothiorhodospiraceae bacterium]|nr:PAS domain S-box protein [Ectothiorhodospiraceae bacterium]
MLSDSVTKTRRIAEQLFEELYDPAFLIDPGAGCFVGANRAACAFLGYGPDELRELTPADIHPHEIPRLDAFLETVRRNQRWSTDELACRTKAGALVPAQVRASLVTLDDKAYILAIVRDRREEQLAELGRSIRKLTHDLRNTMVSSRLMGDRLRKHEDPIVQRSAELIIRSVDRAVHMCQEALLAGSAREQKPSRERFPLSDAVAELTAAIGPEEVADARLETVGEDVVLDADFDQFFRVLLNLVRNALAAGATRLVIAGNRDDATVVIDVQDDGPGIPARVKGDLFRDKTLVPDHGSTGLGLTIAWELVHNHGGVLTLVQTGPQGTHFRITLPA